MEHWGPGTGDRRYVVCDSDHNRKRDGDSGRDPQNADGTQLPPVLCDPA